MDNLESRPYASKIREYVKTLVENLSEPVTIVLYGSMARGDYNIGSDIDLLIISDSLPKHPLERASYLFGLNYTNAPIEPKGYTTEEFSKLIMKLNIAALDSLTEGIVLVDAGNWRDFEKEFDVVRRDYELERTKRGWVSHRAIREARRA